MAGQQPERKTGVRVRAAGILIPLVMFSTLVMADEPTLVLDPRTDVPSGPFGYELLDTLRPTTANLVREMNACFERGNQGDLMRIRVLVSLNKDGAVTGVRHHPEMLGHKKPELEAVIEAVEACGPFDNGGRPDVYRLLDIVLVDPGS